MIVSIYGGDQALTILAVLGILPIICNDGMYIIHSIICIYNNAEY